MTNISTENFEKVLNGYLYNLLKKFKSKQPCHDEDFIFPPSHYAMADKSFTSEQWSKILGQINTVNDYNVNSRVITIRLGRTEFDKDMLFLLTLYDGQVALQFDYLLNDAQSQRFADAAPRTKIIGQASLNNNKILHHRFNGGSFFLNSSCFGSDSTSDKVIPHTLGHQQTQVVVRYVNDLADLCTKEANIQTRIIFKKYSSQALALSTSQQANNRIHEQRDEYKKISERFYTTMNIEDADYLVCLLSDFFAMRLTSVEKDKQNVASLFAKNSHLNEFNDLLNCYDEEMTKIHAILDYLKNNIVSSLFQSVKQSFNVGAWTYREHERKIETNLPLKTGAILCIQWKTILEHFFNLLHLSIHTNTPLDGLNVSEDSFFINQLIQIQQKNVIDHSQGDKGNCSPFFIENFASIEQLYGPIYRSILNFMAYEDKFSSNFSNEIIQDHMTTFKQLLKQQHDKDGVFTLLSDNLKIKGNDTLATYLVDLNKKLTMSSDKNLSQDIFEWLEQGGASDSRAKII